MLKFLYNKAANFVRDRRRERKRFLVGEVVHREKGSSPSGRNFFFQEQISDPLEFANLWNQLPSQLRDLWISLLEENGNQVRLANRLGKHRNTIRSWLQQIRRVLVAHGFVQTESCNTKSPACGR
jgi:DNA-directed RNA polymerase specialized sigma24 family protein